MRWCLVLLVGCGRIGFGTADAGGPGGDGIGPGDGIVVTGDGMVSGCIDPGSGDTFPGGLPCSGWGMPIAMNAGLSESNGTLTITPNSNTANVRGACSHVSVPFTAGGVIAEVSLISTGATTYLTLSGSTGAFSFQTSMGSFITPLDGGPGPFPLLTYSAVADRWWRIRPSAGNVEFETSPDGTVWTHEYTSMTAAPAMVTIELGAQTVTAQATPGIAKFESVNTCP